MKKLILAGARRRLLGTAAYGAASRSTVLGERLWLALLASACLVVVPSPLLAPYAYYWHPYGYWHHHPYAWRY